MGVHNATKKAGNLLGGRPDKDLQRTENIFQGEKTLSAATSVSEHHRNDAAVKAAARPETFEAHGPRVKKISLGGLNNPLPRSLLDTNVVTIPGGMTKTVGFVGKTLPWKDMA